MSNETSLRIYRMRIQTVIDHITAHLAEDLPLDVLADAACFSPYHFHRIFTLLVGETPLEFTNRLRLERAANMLAYRSGASVTEIALACGFSSSATFSRSFRKYFGVSATEWRMNRKNCKTESNIGKADAAHSWYIDDVQREHEQSSTTTERSTVMNVTVTHLPSYHVAYVANLDGYDPLKIKAAWEKLCQWGGMHGLMGPETIMLGISFDNPDITPKDKCRYYACITVPTETHIPPGFGTMELPEGRYAVMHVEGKDDVFMQAYRDLYGVWLPRSGYVPADSPCYEIYRSTPEQNPKGDFVIDICLPVVPL